MIAVCTVLAALVAINVLGYLHARAFTHYRESADKTKDPEDLSWGEKARMLVTGVSQPRPEIDDKPWFWTRYTVHTYPSTDGHTLEAWHIPTKNARGLVVMFHGYGAAKDSLLRESSAFRSMGFSTFLVDFRGSGGSTGSVTTIGYREADDVVASMEYARKLEPELPVVIYGSSMGAAAALRAMAEKGVKPAAAVLECPFDSLLSTIQNRFHMMHAPAFPGAQILVFWGGLQFGYNGFAFNPSEYAGRVKTPVLLIGGGRDRRVTVEQMKRIYEPLAGPKRLEIFEDIGHGGYLKNESRRWRSVVEEFVAPQLKSAEEPAA